LFLVFIRYWSLITELNFIKFLNFLHNTMGIAYDFLKLHLILYLLCPYKFKSSKCSQISTVDSRKNALFLFFRLILIRLLVNSYFLWKSFFLLLQPTKVVLVWFWKIFKSTTCFSTSHFNVCKIVRAFLPQFTWLKLKKAVLKIAELCGKLPERQKNFGKLQKLQNLRKNLEIFKVKVGFPKKISWHYSLQTGWIVNSNQTWYIRAM
jgi:hypothetical protein